MSAGISSRCIAAGGLLGAIAVAAGAFGAHGLKAMLEAAGHADTWETGSRYALFHALALVATGAVAALPDAARCRRPLGAAAWCFLLGTLVFSGCLWTLSLTDIRRLGAVVPVGGSLLVAGWVLLAVGGIRLGVAPHSSGRR